MSGWKHYEDPFEGSIGARFDLDQSTGVKFGLGAVNRRYLNGRITLSNERGVSAATTQVFDVDEFDVSHDSDLYGGSERGLVSLISCYRGRFRFSHGIRGSAISSTIHSSYAVFGSSHLNRDDPVIRNVTFGFDDLHTYFHGTRPSHTSITLRDVHPSIVDAIDKHKPDYMKTSPTQYDHPHVLCFDGRHDLLPTIQTSIGRVSLRCLIHGRKSAGVGFNDELYISIDTSMDPVKMDDAIMNAHKVRNFFSWMIGYAPTYKRMMIFKGDNPFGDQKGAYDPGLDVFLSHRGGITVDNSKLGGSILINPGHQPDQFTEVMKNWLDRYSDRRLANITYHSIMQGMFVTVMESKMCSAANLFDQLPASDKKGKSKMLDIALNRYRKKIRPNLDLPRMDKVIESAVNCRHYLTHGETNRERHGVDYNSHQAVVFLTNALRFVYGASELIECGWDMKYWLGLSFKHEHALGRFIETYGKELAATMP